MPFTVCPKTFPSISLLVLLIAVIALFAFSSCEKSGIILLEKAPELKGEWVWTHTVVGGVVGIIHAEPEKSLVIDFKDNNTISVKYDDRRQ